MQGVTGFSLLQVLCTFASTKCLMQTLTRCAVKLTIESLKSTTNTEKKRKKKSLTHALGCNERHCECVSELGVRQQ